jgi:hypothetical protein
MPFISSICVFPFDLSLRHHAEPQLLLIFSGGETIPLMHVVTMKLLHCSTQELWLSEVRRDARWRKGRFGNDGRNLWRGGHTCVYKTRTYRQVASSFNCSTVEPPFRENVVIRFGLRCGRLRSWPRSKTELWCGVA